MVGMVLILIRHGLKTKDKINVFKHSWMQWKVAETPTYDEIFEVARTSIAIADQLRT